MFRKKIVPVITFLLIIGSCTMLASADQTNDSDKYTFQNYGGEVYTPEPMEFGANLNDDFILEYGTERKHMMLQFYENTTGEQISLLDSYGLIYIGKATDYTFTFSMPADMTTADLPAESGLRWMGEIPVENKYDQNYGLDVPEWARTENGDVKLGILFYEDVVSKDSTSVVRKYSDNFSTPLNGIPWYYETIINETDIVLIVSEDSVQRVDYYGAEVVPDYDGDSVDYEVMTEEDEPDTVDGQEDDIQEITENSDEQEENKSPGFTATIGILIFALVVIFSEKKQGKSKRK